MENTDLKDMGTESDNELKASVLDDVELEEVAGGLGNLPDHVLQRLDGYEVYTLKDLYARAEEAERQEERAAARSYYRSALILESQIRRKYNV